MIESVTLGMLLLLAAIAIAILRTGHLVVAVMLSGAFSLTSAALFAGLGAVDVAFTEAAVGAGLSTVLAIGAIALAGHHEGAPSPRRCLSALIACAAVGAALFYASLDFPRFADPNAPIHTHVAPDYISGSAREMGIPNVVTSVLASYRGFDTLGETAVVFTAGVACLLLLGFLPETLPPQPARGAPSFRRPFLPTMAKLLIPLIALFGLYVQFHGDYGPGGGFQAGVIVAAGYILYALIFGVHVARTAVPDAVILTGLSGGLALYAGVGFLSMAAGGHSRPFLDYHAFGHGHHGQHIGILLVEFGVGITVTSVMIAIFNAFARRSVRLRNGEEDR